MFYEEKVIGDSIYFRTTPNGKWKCKEIESVAFKLLRGMTPTDRACVLRKFCSYCGMEKKHCCCESC